MPFTVDDFEDLVRLLEERPDWRARLRDLLLPREILELPAAVAELARISREALQRLDRLEKAQTRMEADIAGLKDGQARLEDGQARMQADIVGLKDGQARLHSDLAVIKGQGLEQRFKELTPLFAHLVADPRALSAAELYEWLQQFVSAGRLTPAEAMRILRSDIVFQGRQNGDSACVVVEVSWSVDGSDVRRARDRAVLLRKAVPRTLAAVAGHRISPDAAALAVAEGVERVIDAEPDEEAES